LSYISLLRAIEARELCRERVISIGVTKRLMDAVELMVAHGVRHLLKVEGEDVAGVLSVRDVIEELSRDPGNVFSTKIGDVGSREIYWVPQEASLMDTISALAEKDIGVVAIWRENSILCFVGEKDIIRTAARWDLRGRVYSAMSKDVRYLTPESTVSDAVRLMAREKVRHVPVVSSFGLIGMFTSRDLLNKLVGRTMEGVDELWLTSLEQVASPNPLTIDASSPLNEALKIMRSFNVGSLLVMEYGELVGILTERDVVKYIYKLIGGERIES